MRLGCDGLAAVAGNIRDFIRKMASGGRLVSGNTHMMQLITVETTIYTKNKPSIGTRFFCSFCQSANASTSAWPMIYAAATTATGAVSIVIYGCPLLITLWVLL